MAKQKNNTDPDPIEDKITEPQPPEETREPALEDLPGPASLNLPTIGRVVHVYSPARDFGPFPAIVTGEGSDLEVTVFVSKSAPRALFSQHEVDAGSAPRSGVKAFGPEHVGMEPEEFHSEQLYWTWPPRS